MVNVNSTLCSQSSNHIYKFLVDPFAPYIDKWYYILSDFYIFFMGLCTNFANKLILSILSIFSESFGIVKQQEKLDDDLGKILESIALELTDNHSRKKMKRK